MNLFGGWFNKATAVDTNMVNSNGHLKICHCVACQTSPASWNTYHGQSSPGMWGQNAARHPSLTVEEERELAELKKERAIETKRLKLEHFKQLAPQVRQHLVDYFLWHATLRHMKTIKAPTSDKEVELRAKSPHLIDYQNNSLAVSGWNEVWLLDDLTETDIINAHNEATMEESLKDEQ
jgi:hypothetical protein